MFMLRGERLIKKLATVMDDGRIAIKTETDKWTDKWVYMEYKNVSVCICGDVLEFAVSL